MTTVPPADLDPVTLESLSSRLISITDESAAALLRTSEVRRDSYGHSSSVPRVLDEGYDDSLAYVLWMARIDGGQAVRVTTPSGTSRRIEIVRRPSPNGTGTVLLYRCPIREKPRRFLYPLAAPFGRLVDYEVLRCQDCAGLRWRCQGRYRPKLVREFEATVAHAVGLSQYTEPRLRVPWDARAVSDPRLLHAVSGVDRGPGWHSDACATGSSHWVPEGQCHGQGGQRTPKGVRDRRAPEAHRSAAGPARRRERGHTPPKLWSLQD